MEIGVTFSHKHIKDLDLDLDKSLIGLNELGIKWVRLCCYWNEVESTEGRFNFESIQKLINFCEINKINIVFSVGMKSPRYPEYYIPSWVRKKNKLRHGETISISNTYLLNKTTSFVRRAVNKFKKYKSIKIWQVENEPLDPSGDSWLSIGKDFLNEEVKLVKRLDPSRKIMVNLWGNLLGIRKKYKQAIQLADIIGIDLYLRCPVVFLKFFHKFVGPLDTGSRMNSIIAEIKDASKRLFIAELQMEPWEPNEIVTKKSNPRSFLPKHFIENIEFAKSLNPEVTLLWGYEYWLWRKANGDDRYWNEAKKYFRKINNENCIC